jgi:membrane fusion protein (multidrug efflux system)
MKVIFCPPIILALFCLAPAGCHTSEAEQQHEEHHKVIVTSPIEKDVVLTEEYVCQIHSRRHIEVRALEGGYLEEIAVREGQAVKEGDLMFKILPVLYKAKLDTEVAEAQLVQIEYNNTRKLLEQNVVSQQELALAEAKLAKAKAKVQLARAELNFAYIKAPFDGIVDRLHSQLGSLISEGDILTTLSDNDVMWVYFNVPEARYLEYKEKMEQQQEAERSKAGGDVKGTRDGRDQDNHHQGNERVAGGDLKIDLILANGNKFEQIGAIGAIEADFNNETGNIAFRADFPNPDGLLRHGQTGTILIHRTVHDAIIIPQRSTFEILAKRYVWVINKESIAHQHEVNIVSTLDDVFLVKGDLSPADKIVLEGVLQVSDGKKVEYEYKSPKEVYGHLKYRAE